MDRFVFLTVNGVALGAIYASVAIALVIIFRTTRVLNFAQGAMAVASAYGGMAVIEYSGSYWLGFTAALVLGGALGAAARLTVFRSADRQGHLNPIVIGIGLLIVIESALAIAFGPTERHLSTAFSRDLLHLGGTALLSRQDLFTLLAVGVVMSLLAWTLTRTRIGLQMRATAFNPVVARLHGIKVGHILTLGWVIAGVVGALAAMLVVPTGLGLFPQAMDLVFVLGFTSAVIGGLDSLSGAMIGGVATGLALSYASGYLGSELTYVAAFVLLLGVLLLTPAGLFAGTTARSV